MFTLTANQAAELAAERAEHNNDRAARNASSLPRESWIAWDAEFVTAAEQYLAVMDDLSNSVSTVIEIGKTEHGYETVDGGWTAKRTKDFTYEAQKKRSVLDEYRSPVPVFSETFEIGFREAQNVDGAAQGQLGAAMRANAMRAVLVSMEDYSLNGDDTISINGVAAKGIRNHSAVNQLTDTTIPLLTKANGSQWETACYSLLNSLLEDNHGGKNVTLYVGSGAWLKAATTPYNSSGGGGLTKISEFIRTMEGVNGVVHSQQIPNNEIIAVVKDKSVIEVPYGMPPAVRAMGRPDMRAPFPYAAEAVAGVTIKRDANGRCGISRIVVNTV